MKLTHAQTQALINAAVTTLVIVLTLLGYTVTVLDPAQRIVIERMEAQAAAIERMSGQVETLSGIAAALERVQAPHAGR